jgi:hypothetical protein
MLAIASSDTRALSRSGLYPTSCPDFTIHLELVGPALSSVRRVSYSVCDPIGSNVMYIY